MSDDIIEEAIKFFFTFAVFYFFGAPSWFAMGMAWLTVLTPLQVKDSQ